MTECIREQNTHIDHDNFMKIILENELEMELQDSTRSWDKFFKFTLVKRDKL